jgi:phosphopantetheinyl transferase
MSAGIRAGIRPVAPCVPMSGGAWSVSQIGGVTVHLLDTRRLPLGVRALSSLTLAERQEWRAIRSRTAARLFLASRAMALPMARGFDRRNRQIRRLPSGQPMLCHGHISISRCYPYVAFALADRPLGLDLERIRYDEGLIDGVATLFSTAEQQVLRHPATRASAFCRIWSRKEALAKRQGCGICTDLAALDTLHPASRLHSRRLRGGYWLSLAR